MAFRRQLLLVALVLSVNLGRPESTATLPKGLAERVEELLRAARAGDRAGVMKCVTPDPEACDAEDFDEFADKHPLLSWRIVSVKMDAAPVPAKFEGCSGRTFTVDSSSVVTVAVVSDNGVGSHESEQGWVFIQGKWYWDVSRDC